MAPGRRGKETGREVDDTRGLALNDLAVEEGEIFHAKYACSAVENGSVSTLEIMWDLSKRAYTPGAAVT
jgi:hypothetical protein